MAAQTSHYVVIGGTKHDYAVLCESCDGTWAWCGIGACPLYGPDSVFASLADAIARCEQAPVRHGDIFVAELPCHASRMARVYTRAA